MSNRARQTAAICPAGKNRALTDEQVYTMVMLHQYQRLSCEKIARRFGISAGQVRDLIARRVNSGCCG